MKKILSVLIIVMMLFAMTGCAGGDTSPNQTENNTEISISDLKQGDEVSIVGQVAAGTLEGGNTLWVQVQQEDKTFVLYKCQLKDEYVSQAEGYEMTNAVKIKGLFLSLTDLQVENVMPVIVLYDCEIIE